MNPIRRLNKNADCIEPCTSQWLGFHICRPVWRHILVSGIVAVLIIRIILYARFVWKSFLKFFLKMDYYGMEYFIFFVKLDYFLGRYAPVDEILGCTIWDKEDFSKIRATLISS